MVDTSAELIVKRAVISGIREECQTCNAEEILRNIVTSVDASQVREQVVHNLSAMYGNTSQYDDIMSELPDAASVLQTLKDDLDRVISNMTAEGCDEQCMLAFDSFSLDDMFSALRSQADNWYNWQVFEAQFETQWNMYMNESLHPYDKISKKAFKNEFAEIQARLARSISYGEGTYDHNDQAARVLCIADVEYSRLNQTLGPDLDYHLWNQKMSEFCNTGVLPRELQMYFGGQEQIEYGYQECVADVTNAGHDQDTYEKYLGMCEKQFNPDGRLTINQPLRGEANEGCTFC